ncbi:hypothetical protein [Thioclava sp.]|uniref:hypothetical protein n=1 Tax=Thioclava sp. TaxID=1933450 RepID=UPI003AA83018
MPPPETSNHPRSLEGGARYAQVELRMQDLTAQQLALSDKIEALIASAKACLADRGCIKRL